MYLESLHLINFKSYLEANLHFSPRINVFVGKNGSGKTNLLDAIFYLGFTKSAFSSSDQQCISLGQSSFFLRGVFRTNSNTNMVATTIQLGAKKIFKENSDEYQKLSEHIGKYPIVIIAPDDVDLVKEGSEGRRKFFDEIISQIDKLYLDNLIQYHHALKLRNSMLRMYVERGAEVDWMAIESYDNILAATGTSIFQKRLQFTEEFLPVFEKYYLYLVDETERATIRYCSELTQTEFFNGLREGRRKDMLQQRTNFGIHRDDFEFLLGNEVLKKLGSQGQQKSFVIAMKLAQFEILENHKGFKPILLLDDIFDKLDDFRIARLLELIKMDFGQLFITDARAEITMGLLRQIAVPSTIFTIEEGKVNLHEYQEK